MSDIWVPLLLAAILLAGLAAWVRRGRPVRRATDRSPAGYDSAGCAATEPWSSRSACGDGRRDSGCDGDSGGDSGGCGGDGGGGD